MSYFGSTEYLIQVGRGLVPGVGSVNVVGSGPISNIGMVDIWDAGGSATEMTAPTNLQISSTNAGDTTVTIAVSGVSGLYAAHQQVAVLNGQTGVTVPSDWNGMIRGIQTVGGTAPLGAVYLSVAGATLVGGVPSNQADIKAKMSIGDNISHNSFITIPAGKSAMVIKPYVGVSAKDKEFNYCFAVKPENGVFANFLFGTVINNTIVYPIESSVLFPEKSILKARATYTGAGSEVVGAGATILIIDN